jgi:hypothetical protein
LGCFFLLSVKYFEQVEVELRFHSAGDGGLEHGWLLSMSGAAGCVLAQSVSKRDSNPGCVESFGKRPFPEVRGGSSGIPRVAPAFRNLWKRDAPLSGYCSGVI